MFFNASNSEWAKKKAHRVPSWWSALLILLITLSNVSNTKAQNKNPNDMNTKFDPEAGREKNTIMCTIPPYQKPAFEATADMCEAATMNLEDLTEEQLTALATEYAPYLFFHPLERYAIESVDTTFADPSKGEVWKQSPTKRVTETLDQSFMLETIRNLDLSMHSSKYFFIHELTEEYKAGAGFDAPEGNMRKSKAPIYFNAFQYKKEETDTHYTWIFNYYFYYTYNGVANMGSLSSYNGTESYTPFTLSPFGLHEGDWEGMSIMVCPSQNPSQPLAVTYQQHGWQQTTDCTAGECTFFKDSEGSNHAVGFSALNSHATFPLSTYNLVYSNVEVSFFVNLQGILVVDRTAYLAEDGTYRAFVPTKENVSNKGNVVMIESPKQTYDDDKKWQGFGGHWGNSTKPTIFPELEACLDEHQTKTKPCPTQEEDPIFHLVMQILNVREADEDLISQAGKAVGSQLLPMFSQTGIGPTGPILKSHWGNWPDPSNAPLWNSGLDPKTTAEEYCKRLGEIPDTGRLPADTNDLDVIGHLVGIIVFVMGLVVLTVVFLMMEKRMRREAIEFDPHTSEVVKPTKRTWFQLHLTSFTFAFWWVVVVVGAIMFGVGLGQLFDMLKMYISGIDWDAIANLIIALGTLIMVIDFVLMILIWLPSQSIWKKIMQIYHHYQGDEGEVEVYKQDCCNISFNKLHVMFLIFFPLLFVSLMLTLVVVVIGVAVVGFSAAFNELCDATIGSLGQYCLDLGFFGIDKIACGADFREFCSQWATNERLLSLWGSILIAVGHFYLVGAAGASYKQQSSIMPMLDMLPTRKEYLQRIEDLQNEQPDLHESSKTNQSAFMENLKQ